jgi:glucose-1-phosphate cytidylyltransferase
MKAVILAGGRGTRLAEETGLRPKPMIMIGGKPILLHVMEIYARHGVRDFVICLGYKGYLIKEYFANFALHTARAVTFDFKAGATSYEHASRSQWRVTLVETGEDTQTGGRLKQVEPWLKDEEYFALTYGDGLGNVDIGASVAHHRKSGLLATVTAVTQPGRFGALHLEGERVTRFIEKPDTDEQAINGGFFVLSPRVLSYIEGDAAVWEKEPLQRLARDGQLSAYRHKGFWQPMDTMRERDLLEQLWQSGKAPWIGDER